MLMKTKENRSDNLTYPTMLMEINDLILRGHDMHENKDTYLKS